MLLMGSEEDVFDTVEHDEAIAPKHKHVNIMLFFMFYYFLLQEQVGTASLKFLYDAE